MRPIEPKVFTDMWRNHNKTGTSETSWHNWIHRGSHYSVIQKLYNKVQTTVGLLPKEIMGMGETDEGRLDRPWGEMEEAGVSDELLSRNSGEGGEGGGGDDRYLMLFFTPIVVMSFNVLRGQGDILLPVNLEGLYLGWHKMQCYHEYNLDSLFMKHSLNLIGEVWE